MRPAIDNWTSDDEARELARLAAGKVVLEVGTYKGFGAVLMAQAGAQVWAVDWHRGDPDLGRTDTLCAWWRNIRHYGVEDRVIGLVGRSAPVLAALREEWFDLVFIDADHSYEAVWEDIECALPLIVPGGIIAFHDYSPIWPGVVKAVDELRVRLGSSGDFVLVGSLASIALKESSRDS